MIRTKLFLCLLLSSAFLFLSSVVEAKEVAKCKVFEIEASNVTGAGAIDKELKPLTKKFNQPLFKAWNRFKSLSSKQLRVALNHRAKMKLVGGEDFSILLRAKTQKKNSRDRFTLSLEVEKKSKRILDTEVEVDSGIFLLMGNVIKMPKGKAHFIAISCR